MSNITITIDSATVAAYEAADRAEKARIRTELNADMMSAVAALDMSAAANAKATLEAALATSKSSPEKVDLDPAQVIANRVATLRAAADSLESGEVAPFGLDAQDVTSVTGEVDLDAATKLATAKITRSGVRHSIAEVVSRALEGTTSGTTLTVAEISRRGAIEGYRPSQGAISNYIRKNNVAGTTIEEAPLRMVIA